MYGQSASESDMTVGQNGRSIMPGEGRPDRTSVGATVWSSCSSRGAWHTRRGDSPVPSRRVLLASSVVPSNSPARQPTFTCGEVPCTAGGPFRRAGHLDPRILPDRQTAARLLSIGGLVPGWEEVLDL